MKELLYNPYRILGLFGGAGEREIRKNKSKIEAYRRVGKTAILDNDINAKPPKRDEKAVAEALSKIENYENRVFYSLFWFVNDKHYDDAALSYLVSGKIEKAEEIWGKVVSNQKVSQQNYSGFNNYGSLKFLLSFKAKGEQKNNLIEEGIIHKQILIESSYAYNFAQSVTDDSYLLNTESILKRFINSLDNNPALERISLIGILSKYGVSISESTKYVLLNKPLNEIESSLDDALNVKKNNPSNAYKAAKNLDKNSNKNLPVIRKILGENDFKYETIRNNVANEILQSAIAYFNHYAERNVKKFGEEAESLALKAYKLATNKDIIDKASKNLENIRTWKKTVNIHKELNELRNNLDAVSNKRYYTLDDADDIYESSKSLLFRIERDLGADDNIYLNCSSDTVTVIQNIIIAVVNGLQEKLPYGAVHPETVRSAILRAHSIQQKIGGMDMHPNTRDFFLKNKRSLDSLKSQVTSPAQPGGGQGCFIASVAYGTYEDPQVQKLRKLRDNILQNYITGRAFIKIYYCISPLIAQFMQDKIYLKKLTRRFLDLLINKFGKSW